MLENVDKQDAKVDIEIVEEKQVIDPIIEVEDLIHDLNLLKQTYSEKFPKEMSKFDWYNGTTEVKALKCFIRQWKGKFRVKNYDYSSLPFKCVVPYY